METEIETRAEKKEECADADRRMPGKEMEGYVVGWMRGMEGKLACAVKASGENLGHMEELVMKGSRELSRRLLEEAAQAKADTAGPRYEHCGGPLERFGGEHKREVESRFGKITITRKRGWCRRCKSWSYPADALLGVMGGHTPGVQEMAALSVSKMPAAEASAVIERLTGAKLSRSTLDRAVRKEGRRAQEKRAQLDEQMKGPRAQEQQALKAAPGRDVPLVIEIDAWNIRERDQWGESKQLRAQGREPERWHWVYTATCFQLSQRAETAGGGPVIASRGYVATRGGIDELREQLYAEASRHGLGQAQNVLVIAEHAAAVRVDDHGQIQPCVGAPRRFEALAYQRHEGFVGALAFAARAVGPRMIAAARHFHRLA